MASTDNPPAESSKGKSQQADNSKLESLKKDLSEVMSNPIAETSKGQSQQIDDLQTKGSERDIPQAVSSPQAESSTGKGRQDDDLQAEGSEKEISQTISNEQAESSGEEGSENSFPQGSPVLQTEGADAGTLWYCVESMKASYLACGNLCDECLSEFVPQVVLNGTYQGEDLTEQCIASLRNKQGNLEEYLILVGILPLVINWCDHVRRLESLNERQRLVHWQYCLGKDPPQFYLWLEPFSAIIDVELIFDGSDPTASNTNKSASWHRFLETLFLLSVDLVFLHILLRPLQKIVRKALQDVPDFDAVRQHPYMRRLAVDLDKWPLPVRETVSPERAKELHVMILDLTGAEAQRLVSRYTRQNQAENSNIPSGGELRELVSQEISGDNVPEREGPNTVPAAPNNSPLRANTAPAALVSNNRPEGEGSNTAPPAVPLDDLEPGVLQS